MNALRIKEIEKKLRLREQLNEDLQKELRAEKSVLEQANP